jgi:hypothetical protein
VKLSARLVEEFRNGLLPAQRRPIRASRRHRVVAIGGDQYVGFDWNRMSVDAEIAGSVPTLVMERRELRDLSGERERTEQLRRQTRVHAYLRDLVLGQTIGSRQGAGVHRDLAEVMEPGGRDEPLRLPSWQIERGDESTYEFGDALRVLGGRGVPGIDDVRHRLQRLFGLPP